MISRVPIRTSEAPAAIGAYSQGIVAGDFVFTSGQLPMTADGELITDDVGAAARQALENALAVLAAAGAGPDDVVKVTIYLADMDDFDRVNAVYGEFFSEPFPARSCVEVSRLPKAARIEIEAVARNGGGREP